MLLRILFILACTTANCIAEEKWKSIWTSIEKPVEIFDMDEETFLKTFHDNVVQAVIQEIQQQNLRMKESFVEERKQLLEDFGKIQREINQELEHKMDQNILKIFEKIKEHNENQQKEIKGLCVELKTMQNMLRTELKSDETKSQYDSIQQDMLDLKNKQQNTIEVVINELQKDHKQIQHLYAEIKNNTEKHFDGNYPSSCEEAVHREDSSGIYTIQVSILNAPPFAVYCEVDPEGGPAWTIFQRRMDGTVDFYRNWTEYQNGFGNTDGEYFLGLDRLHRMTNATKMELWIKLEDFENETRNAKYTSFQVGNELESYILHDVGKHSGDLGDSFWRHKGYKFTTKDKDNDMSNSTNCAVYKHGAWWYKACDWSNLNGRYMRGYYSREFDSQGVTWGKWHGFQYSLKYTHMAIRLVIV